MSVKLILLDLDGTLLDNNKQLSQANYAALEKCADAGIHIVPSTGRFYSGMPQAVRALPFVRYVVAINGAQVYDVEENKVLSREEIPLEAAFRVFDELDRLPVIYDCYMDSWGYMEERLYARIDEFVPDPHANKMVKELRKPVPDLRAYLREQGKALQKIQMFFADMDRRADALARLPKLFPDMAVSSAIINNIEINTKNANKGQALGFLCAHLGLDLIESMAFGDGSNDLTMVKSAGIGVAMANADPALKQAADYVTDTNDNDGVAKAIARFCF